LGGSCRAIEERESHEMAWEGNKYDNSSRGGATNIRKRDVVSIAKKGSGM